MTARPAPAAVLLLTAGALLMPLLPAVASAQEASPPAPVVTAASAAVLRLTPSTTEVTAGQSVTFSVLARAVDGSPLVAEAVDLLARQGGTTSLVAVGRVITDGSGVATITWKPRVTAEYSLRRVVGTTAGTEKRIVHLTPRLTVVMAPGSVGLGGSGVLLGTLTPAYAGARLQVQRRYPDGVWRNVTVVASNGVGAYAWTVTPGAVGRYVFRTVLPARMAYRGVTTAAVALEVVRLPAAGLSQGSSGAAVRALEVALLAQKADIGRLDGVFDNDLRHGVIAFQKSQGLRRTGIYDTATRSRLATPIPVRLRYPASGRAVEIDLAKQVLYLSEAGRLARIVDVSTGNNQLYTVDGITSRAVTPTGRFRILRKIDGIRISRLGELYRPAYFYQGWAIHGSPSVPTYPASHGCVRVTNSAQDRLYPLLTIGTPVSIF